MEIIPFAETSEEDWNSLCQTSDDAWFNHTTYHLKYWLNMLTNEEPANFSFIIRENNQILALCPLILRHYKRNGISIKEFASGAIPATNPPPGINPVFSNKLNAKARNKFAKVIYGEIDRLAKENDVARCTFSMYPLTPAFLNSGIFHANPFTKYGYLDISQKLLVIDLGGSLDRLLNNMRKGHKYDVKRADKIFSFEVYEKNNMTTKIFNIYKNLHHKTAGRKTRSDETFELAFQWILEGYFVLFAVKKDDNYAGFTLNCVCKGGSSYGSTPIDPEYKHLPVSHFLQWNIIKWLKRSGFRYYEIGLQHSGNTLSLYPSEKDLNLSLFKRGLGGNMVPFYIGEKFYDKEYFLQVYEERIKRYGDGLS